MKNLTTLLLTNCLGKEDRALSGGIAYDLSPWSWRLERITKRCQNPCALQISKFYLVTITKGTAIAGGSGTAQGNLIQNLACFVPKNTREDKESLLDLIAF